MQTSGQRAFTLLCHSSEVVNPQDTADFQGKEVGRAAWNEIARILKEPHRHNRKLPQSSPKPADDRKGRFIYVIAAEGAEEPLCKVGIANSPEKRLKQLSTASPHNLRLEFSRHSPEVRAVEQAAHLHFMSHRRNGEWFAISTTDAIQFVNAHIDGRPISQWQN
ncbi:MAG: hypothetical protein DI604_17845 [Delftia acidovorans]|nr:MAG: hypothetical protein DI604_17845 [Delftia acidovorans]